MNTNAIESPVKFIIDENGVTHWTRQFGKDVTKLIRSKIKGHVKIKDVGIEDIRKELKKLYPNRRITAEHFKVYKCKLKKQLEKENESKN